MGIRAQRAADSCVCWRGAVSGQMLASCEEQPCPHLPQGKSRAAWNCCADLKPTLHCSLRTPRARSWGREVTPGPGKRQGALGGSGLSGAGAQAEE